MARTVKFGRKKLMYGATGPLAYHWAIKAGDTWYEIAGQSKGDKNGPNIVRRSRGRMAESGAGESGVEIVGDTNRSDSEIDDFITDWLRCNPCYGFTTTNCQKFAYEFMDWLTGGEFIFSHRFNAAECANNTNPSGQDLFWTAKAEDGNAIAGLNSTQSRTSYGPVNFAARATKLQGQAVLQPESVGVFGDASLGRAEASLGNAAGVHFEPNLNTGVGVRNGNVEGHLLGFGGKIGSDGVEINTPIGGANACSIM